jgi:hypothetical protein
MTGYFLFPFSFSLPSSVASLISKMDTQQVATTAKILSNAETALFPESLPKEKSTLRHQIDDLMFGSVRNNQMYRPLKLIISLGRWYDW